MIKSMSEYNSFKRDFFSKHEGLMKVDTTPMNEYSQYSKFYTCTDGSMMYEVNGPIYKDVNITYDVNGLIIKTSTIEKKKFFQSEVWTDDNANSIYFIEQW